MSWENVTSNFVKVADVRILKFSISVSKILESLIKATIHFKRFELDV